MRKSMLAVLALLPLAAMAQDRNCQHSQARDLKLDLAGAKAVVFDIGQHDLNVVTGSEYAVHGRACASDAKYLPELTLTQHRVGDKLVVVARRSERNWFNLGDHYAYLRLEATVPADLMVQLNVGSGDARATGVAALSADVGSGDVRAENVRGQVTADVGSGDIELDNIGSLHVVSVGSGDLKARRIAQNVKVGDIGSGDVELREVGGNVDVDEIGSGDIDVVGVRGNLRVHAVGSGSVDHRDVAGTVAVPRDNE
ncbi:MULTISPECIES: DUF2807 domain-containing protein [unclassified Lysobacter]|uniref:GIN domain-containing protein n=1 Tax=unclassified Lysobacter TaxID=2635362 RepID=UPI00070FD160|nr:MULTISPECIES: DUF2807 domain-containing protein [unclassified Lysobacter]KRD39640.1 hypothetical protein ASE35_04730 [Lysobacter sp. Root916]KRD79607.1 hypothetical protein ASE43_01495 [Lysobacter sp. Root983]